MSTSKKSWFEKAVTSIAAVTGVKSERMAEIIAEVEETSTDVTFGQLVDQVISDLAVELGVPAEMAAGFSQLSVQVCDRLANGVGNRIIPADRVEEARNVLTATIRDAFITLKAGGEIKPKVWDAPLVSAEAKAAATNGLYESIIRAAAAEQGLPAALTEEMVAAVTAQPAAEPTTTVVVASVVEPTPVVTAAPAAAKHAAHVAVKKAAAKKGKRIRTLSDMELLKAELAV